MLLSAGFISVPELKRQSAQPKRLPCAIDHEAVLTTPTPQSQRIQLKFNLLILFLQVINHLSVYKLSICIAPSLTPSISLPLPFFFHSISLFFSLSNLSASWLMQSHYVLNLLQTIITFSQ